ncbi:MAG: GNAT family N-acetyltransferase [Methylibium sp.]
MSRLPERIEADRLLLRLPSAADAGPLNRAIADSFEALNAWMDWAVKPQTLDETRAFCLESRKLWQAGTALNLLMIDKASGSIVGASGYPRLDWSVPRFEIGYWCRTAHVGRGYASEATWALSRCAFEALGAQRVELRMDDRNVRSWRVAERLGFSREAMLRNDVRVADGSLRHTRVYAAISLSELRAPTQPL